MKIFHIATASDWSRALESGNYTTSTAGRTLDQEGFLHAAYREQVDGVFARYYGATEEPLVLLTIDTGKLDVPWRDDRVGDDTYPHIYGPLAPAAVVEVKPLTRRGRTPSFTSMFLGEMVRRMLLVVIAMALSFLGAMVGRNFSSEWGEFGGAIAGLAVGIVVVVVGLRWRRTR